MNTPLLSIFIASLLGSLHCVSMCGGFVVYNTVNSKQKVLSTIFYNSGRLITYLFLGMLAGFLGRGLNNSALLLGISKLSSILVGLILIAAGVVALLKQSQINLVQLNVKTKKRSALSTVSAFMHGLYNQILNDNTLSNIQRALILGMLSTLLPCAWLYSFVALAGASASPIEGLFIMFYFWLGSLPYLLLTALVSDKAFAGLKKITPKIIGVLLILMGIFGIWIHW